MKNYDYVVLIGRFQPFHNSHLELVNEALKVANNKVIIVLGSANCARNIKNPFSAIEREKMILDQLDPELHNKVRFTYVRDYYYNNNLWLSEVQNKVLNICNETKGDGSIALLGHESDSSSAYLKQFPQWNLILTKSTSNIHATDVRNLYFADKSVSKYVPNGVLKFLVEFKKTQDYKLLCDEMSFIKKYKDLWSEAPYAPTFVTTDACVVRSGHVLVVKRKSYPGKGLYCLPGGFLNQEETTREGAIRELKEETSIAISKEELSKQVVCNEVFDYPGRSLRGRTITHCYLIDLGSGPLIKIKGSDDAEKAIWLPLNEVSSQEDKFFEDHWHMISYMLGKL